MFNNRELALLIWLGVALVLMLSKRDLRSSLWGILQTLAHPKLLIPILAMVGWVVAAVHLALAHGWWTSDMAVDTSLWFFGSACVLMFNLDRVSKEQRFLRRAALGVLGIMVFVEVFMNLYVFGLIAELFLLPALTLLTLVSVVASTKSEFKGVKSVMDALLAIAGFAGAGYIIVRLATGWRQVDALEAARTLVMPVWLTTAILPFIYLMALYAGYDAAFLWINFATEDRGIRRRAKLAVLLTLDLRMARSGAFNMPWGQQVTSAQTLRAARWEIQELQRSRLDRTRTAGSSRPGVSSAA